MPDFLAKLFAGSHSSLTPLDPCPQTCPNRRGFIHVFGLSHSYNPGTVEDARGSDRQRL